MMVFQKNAQLQIAHVNVWEIVNKGLSFREKYLSFQEISPYGAYMC